ncbi:MAG TPA: PfkB family carbohydrate kinase, partial [Armatimonadota bacterium]|nr:PfkB family carbohydrate kinase [Armatimonadota bacterium]
PHLRGPPAGDRHPVRSPPTPPSRMHESRLETLLRQFSGKHVVVIGDCMLDEYVWGKVSRISPEAPVVVVEHDRTTYAAGGASNVAANIVAMGARACIVSVVGDDGMGDRLRRELEAQGVCHDGLVIDSARPTTVKTRVLAHSQQVVRVDREERSPVAPEVETALIEQIRRALARADAVLFSDYTKGVLTERVAGAALQIARELGKPAFANPKPSSLSVYKGLSLVTLNQSETEAATGLSLAGTEVLPEAGQRLLRFCGAETAIVTLGGRGLALFEQGKPWRHLPVIPLEVYDPCGCGDSTIAAAALARVSGGDWVEAATVANLAGNAKVRKLGVVPVGREDIRHVFALGEAAGAN